MKSIYMEQVEKKWRDAFSELVAVVETNVPDGFEQTMQYGMVSYVVPLSSYPEGYHVTPNTPLPFISLAAQKRHIALYHMGLCRSSIAFLVPRRVCKASAHKIKYGEKLYSIYKCKKYSI